MSTSNMFEKWITADTKTPFLAEREFFVTGRIKATSVKVCGLGQFILYINGKKVGDHELDPGWTDYRKWIEYVEFDVRDLLKQGRNYISVEVGNGWFIKDDTHYTFRFPEFMPPNPNPYRPFGESLILAAELSIQYESGENVVITTDENWKVGKSSCIMSNVYGSETLDGRIGKIGSLIEEEKEHHIQGNVTSKNGPEEEWKSHEPRILSPDEIPSGELCLQFQPPVKVIKTYPGKKLGTAPHGMIYDFGQNISGMLEAVLKGQEGDEVRIYPAEKLTPEGDVDQMAKGWMEVDNVITCILGPEEGPQCFRQKFTYFSGRYVAVETKNPGTQVLEIKGDAISSAFVTDGQFACDDERYNQIYDLVEKSVEANMLSVHTDCPTIERFAWQEPNHLMAPSIFFMKDGKDLWRKFFKDLRMAQHTSEDYFLDFAGEKVYPGEGLIPSQAPCYIPNVLPVPGMGSFYDIIGWGSSILLGVRWHYLFYGDLEVVRENFSAGERYLKHLETMVDANGFISHGLGDWGHPKQAYARENVETALYYGDICTLIYFAKLLNRSEVVQYWTPVAEQVKENYNRRLLKQTKDKMWLYQLFAENQEGKESLTSQNLPETLEKLLSHTTQAALAMPLYFDLVPAEHQEDVAESLRKKLEQEGAFLAGEVGLPYIIQTASKYGMNDLIARFIVKEEHPSYYAFVLAGETTLGEYWEENPRSHCHDMMGHIIEWYYSGMAGIQILAPGCTKVKITPYLPESMNHLKCTYRSVHGPITVELIRENGSLRIVKELPPEVEEVL